MCIVCTLSLDLRFCDWEPDVRAEPKYPPIIAEWAVTLRHSSRLPHLFELRIVTPTLKNLPGSLFDGSQALQPLFLPAFLLVTEDDVNGHSIDRKCG